MKESARLNALIVFIKVAVVLTFVAIGIAYVNPHNWTPFIPEVTPDGKYGLQGILTGAGVIFFAYIGFDAVSTAAQEAKNPQRDMPIGILGSLCVCTLLYIAVALVLTGIVPYSSLNVADPIAVGIDATGVSWLKAFIKIGAIAGLSSVILVLLYGQSRIFWIMSGDGLLPKAFTKVHPKFKTPYITTGLVGFVVAFFSGLFPIGVLGEMVSIGTLFAFVLVCAGVWILRHKRPHESRPFKAPAIALVAPAGILCCLILMAGLPLATWYRLAIWMVVGLAIYYFYGMKNSRLKD
jgi:APA family basic amino acid/polyamine antiporter